MSCQTCEAVPGISDHHEVVIYSNVKPRYTERKNENHRPTKKQTGSISNLIATLLVLLKPNEKVFDKGTSKPCHIICLLSG